MYRILAILCDLFGMVKWPFQWLSEFGMIEVPYLKNSLLWKAICLILFNGIWTSRAQGKLKEEQKKTSPGKSLWPFWDG